jgi:predicted AAA+ superfamily ATPase
MEFQMNREITNELINWKNRTNRKPFIVRGARQVGKTYTIEQFANTHFKNAIKINFEEQIELKPLFKTQKIEQILNELSILYSTDIIHGETLIFLDEIQACHEAIVTLRYFFEKQPDLHVIAAGSLLDFALTEMSYSIQGLNRLERRQEQSRVAA